MVLAWTVLLPAGVFIARYLKVTRTQDWPRKLDNKLWWHWHVGLQVAGIACMSAGLALLWIESGSSGFGGSLHANLGWLVAGIGWLQVLIGFLRGSKGGPDQPHVQHGDHYQMTWRRVLFEWVHKLGGYLALLLSLWVTGLGLRNVNAPLWMWLTIGLWWVLLLWCATRFQKAGRCVDTYQAIWGADQRHPGNSRAPIGWGIRRIGDDNE